MTISDSTRAILAAQDYIKQFMTLDEQGFVASLADDASCVHARIKGGFGLDPEERTGKKKVSDAYRKFFFAITNNFDLNRVKFKAAGALCVQIECEVDEDKKEEGVVHRYRIACHTQLDFRKEENDVLKIIKIWERTSKDPI